MKGLDVRIYEEMGLGSQMLCRQKEALQLLLMYLSSPGQALMVLGIEPDLSVTQKVYLSYYIGYQLATFMEPNGLQRAAEAISLHGVPHDVNCDAFEIPHLPIQDLDITESRAIKIFKKALIYLSNEHSKAETLLMVAKTTLFKKNEKLFCAYALGKFAEVHDYHPNIFIHLVDLDDYKAIEDDE